MGKYDREIGDIDDQLSEIINSLYGFSQGDTAFRYEGDKRIDLTAEPIKQLEIEKKQLEDLLAAYKSKNIGE